MVVSADVHSIYESRWEKNSLSLEGNVVVPSNYTFFIQSKIDICISIYNSSFHRSNLLLNLSSDVNSSSVNRSIQFNIFLQPWAKYILMVHTPSSNVAETFSIGANGPAAIGFREIRKYKYDLIETDHH